jgi:hypothetical protein
MSRYGSYRKINFERVKEELRRTEIADKVYERFPEYETEEPTVKDFDYTTSPGIWNLRSTTEFHKKGEWVNSIQPGSVVLDYTVNTTGTTTASYTLDFNIPTGATIVSATLVASAAGALKDSTFLFMRYEHIEVKFNGNVLFNNQTGTSSFGTFTQVFNGNVLQYMTSSDTSANLQIRPNGSGVSGDYAVRYILTLNYE